MINIIIFFKTIENFAGFLLLFGLGSVWAYYCFKKDKSFTLTPLIVISALLLLAWGMVTGVDVDEIEHLHCSWLVYSGFVPFKDFWQHHAPMLWIILAPFFKILKPSSEILTLSRIFFGLVYGLIILSGWKLAQKVWQGKARLAMYLLIVFATGIMGQFLCARPDPFATLFLLIFIYWCLEIPGKRLISSFWAGICFGIAMSFIFKQYLLFFLPFILIFKVGKGSRAAKIVAYLTGVFFGVLPLAFYLFNQGVAKEFLFWVIRYNQKRIIFSADFPVAVTVLGGWGVYLLVKRYLVYKDSRALVLCAAFFLSTLSSFTHPFLGLPSYFLEFWYILCAVAGCGQTFQSLIKRVPSMLHRSLVSGLFFAMILSPNIVALTFHNISYFSFDKKVIGQLIKYGAKDSCLTILPYHPIFSRDVSRLYSYWQFNLSEEFLELRDDIRSKDLAAEVRKLRPAVVLSVLDKREFLLELYQKMLISKQEYNDLNDFLQTGYTFKAIGKNGYYIRNDKIEIPRK